ncbi:MAG TPA: DUF2191 domain-containing protein [Acidimicrobiaceae bacterium]|nr:DUF2191 domain-containing protein [Acidimicrobiaceae bacterium]
MARVRLSTTVDEAVLAEARGLGFATDAALVDAALDALVKARRSAEIDRSYEAYDRIPLDTPDEWGNPAAFRAAVTRGEIPQGDRT